MTNFLASLNQHISQSGKETPSTKSVTAAGLHFLLVLLQLGALLWLVHRFEVETSLGLPTLTGLACTGFVIHALLPFSRRLPFLLLFTLGALFWILNWIPALLAFLLILALFAILILPISVRARSLLLLLAAAAMAYVWIALPELLPDAHRIFPIVGTIFVFRASLFLYDTQFEKQRPPIPQLFAYFFMLPNLIITLFPVVDYKRFFRTYYDRLPTEIYLKGVRWMIRGFFHLMLYRIIYYYVQPDPMQVATLSGLAFYAATSYALILRLSGLFHFSVGVLCLFGFNLPPVFHNYFLSSGFSDLWRRINIYWRDYVMKVFYFPLYFRFRAWGNLTGMFISTMIAFAITWLLHSLQWFWIQGNFPLRLLDALFWGILGITVAFNAMYQQAVPKAERPFANSSKISKIALRSIRITGMFGFMALLWTFWNSPSLDHWWQFLAPISEAGLFDWGKLIFLVGSFTLLLFIGLWVFEKPAVKKILEPEETSLGGAAWGSASLLVFLLFCIPNVRLQLQALTSKPIDHLFESRLTQADDQLLIKGYYEDILVPNQLTSPLAELQNRPKDWLAFPKTPLAIHLGNWLQYDIQPDTSVLFKRVRTTTNRWGMRDRDYSLEKPPGTVRIGILGGSYCFGSGVADDEVFETLVEDQFNKERLFGAQYELLNFSVPGFHLMDLTARFEQKVLDFDVDGIMIISHAVDFARAGRTIMQLYQWNLPIELEFVTAITDSLGLYPGDAMELTKGEQSQLGRRIVEACYSHLAMRCTELGIQPIWVHWPRTRDTDIPGDVVEIMEIVRENGYLIYDLEAAYRDVSVEELRLTVFDQHPNQKGHSLIAEALMRSLQNDPLFKDFASQVITSE